MSTSSEGLVWGVITHDPNTGKRETYRPNPKQLIAHLCNADEIFYGGALGGGKSYFLVWHMAAHCLKWGKDANTVMFRRTYDELTGSLVQEFLRLFHGKVGQYKPSEHVFEWAGVNGKPNGAKTWFRHLEKWEDTLKHESRQYSMIAFDELTTFEERQYLYIWRRLRCPHNKNIHPQMLTTGNPGGVGHKWVFERFVQDKQPNTIYEITDAEGNKFSRIFVPAKLDDNVDMLEADPSYKARLKATQSPEDYKAYVEGDWSRFMGLAFAEWQPVLHVVDDFPIPKDWKIVRCLDWGYASPFSVGWLTQNPKTKQIIRIAEWYGAKKGPQGGITGVEMGARDVHAGIVDRERAYRDGKQFGLPWYGVASPDMWKRTGAGPTEADEMNAGEMLFRRADTNRAYTKTLMHSLLNIQPDTGQPGFVSFKSCDHFNNIFPKLIKDPKDPDKVEDKNQEDHVYEECGYGLVELARGNANTRPVEEARILSRMTQRPVLV